MKYLKYTNKVFMVFLILPSSMVFAEQKLNPTHQNKLEAPQRVAKQPTTSVPANTQKIDQQNEQPTLQITQKQFKEWKVINGVRVPVFRVSNTQHTAQASLNNTDNKALNPQTANLKTANLKTGMKPQHAENLVSGKAVSSPQIMIRPNIPVAKVADLSTPIISQQNTVAKPIAKQSLRSNNSTKPTQDSNIQPNIISGFSQKEPKLINREQVGQIQCLSDRSVNLGKSLDLISAIERAICQNPDAKIAWIETKIKAAQVKLAQSSYYPQVSANYDYTRGKNNYDVKNADYLSYNTSITRYGLAVQANWLLYDFGGRKQLANEAKALLAMSFAQQDAVLQTVMVQVIQAYYDVLKVELQIDNATQLKTFAQKNFDIASARYKAGAGIKSDQLQMQANLQKSKSDLIKLKGDLKVAKGQLAAIMGNMAYQDFSVRSEDLKRIKLMDLKPIQSLLDQAVQSNPQLKQAQSAILAAQHKVKAVERTRYPSLSLVSNFNDYTQEGERSSANTSRQIQAGIQLSIPIFDGFSRKYQGIEARQNLQQRYVDKEKIELQLVQDIWKNYQLLEASMDNIYALQSLNESAEQSYAVAQGRYQTGVGNILELINAQNLLTESKMKYSTAVTEYLVIRYQLLSYVGTLNVW